MCSKCGHLYLLLLQLLLLLLLLLLLNQSLLGFETLPRSRPLRWTGTPLRWSRILSGSPERPLFLFLPVSLHGRHEHLIQHLAELLWVADPWQGAHHMLNHVDRLLLLVSGPVFLFLSWGGTAVVGSLLRLGWWLLISWTTTVFLWSSLDSSRSSCRTSRLLP